MDGLGELLKQQRESRGIRLEEVASITKIHIKTLSAIEEEKWEALPSDPFLRGFITSYAQHIGLNAKDVLSNYYDSSPQGKKEDAPLEPTESKKRRTSAVTSDQNTADSTIKKAKPFNFYKALGMGTLAFGLLVVIGITFLGKNRLEETPLGQLAQSPTPTEQVNELPVLEDPYGESPLETQTQPPSDLSQQMKSAGSMAPPQSGHRLSIQVQEKSWAKILVDDSPARETFFTPDKPHLIEAKEKIKVILGNADTAVVTHNEEVKKGRVLKAGVSLFVYPPGAKFPQDVAPPPPKEVRSVAKEVPPTREEKTAPPGPSPSPTPAPEKEEEQETRRYAPPS